MADVLTGQGVEVHLGTRATSVRRAPGRGAVSLTLDDDTVLQMAILARLPYQSVRDAVITHPTMGEGLNLLFDTLGDEPHLTGPAG